MTNSDRPAPVVPHDSTIVGVHEPHELEYWAKHFGVGREDVVRAVQDVGPKVADVAFELRGVRSCDV